jgi:DNA-directed RNA polymerase subunit RPC12/RpoP
VTARYRCSACGNQTRFDVVKSRRTRAFHHFTVGGDLRVEDEVVLDESVDDVSCRWCGSGASVAAIVDEADTALVGSDLVGSDVGPPRAPDAPGEI